MWGRNQQGQCGRSMVKEGSIFSPTLTENTIAGPAEQLDCGSQHTVVLSQSGNVYTFGDNSQDYSSAEGSLTDAILAERRLELAAEGHYFFDLVRTGKAKAAFQSYNSNYASGETRPEILYTEDKNEFLPIPLVELELANAIDRWGQNEGY